MIQPAGELIIFAAFAYAGFRILLAMGQDSLHNIPDDHTDADTRTAALVDLINKGE